MTRFSLIVALFAATCLAVQPGVAQQRDTTSVAPDSADALLRTDVLEAITVTGVLSPARQNRLGFCFRSFVVNYGRGRVSF